MKAVYLLTLTVLYSAMAAAQPSYKTAIKNLNSSFETRGSLPQVFLLGVFHFAGEQVDSNTTQFKWRYRADEPRRMKEIEALRDKLVKIKPTVICVELLPSWQSKLDSAYAKYCQGHDSSAPGFKGEIALLAFEVGKRLGVKRIVAVDAQPMEALKDERIYNEYQKVAPKRDALFSHWDSVYYRNSAFADSLRHQWTTLEFLRFINSDEYHSRLLGRWLITTRFGSGANPVGADQFITRYYNRNIRIYSNIQRSITSDEDRVLVIYGNTHMAVLQNLFSASPLYRSIKPQHFLE